MIGSGTYGNVYRLDEKGKNMIEKRYKHIKEKELRHDILVETNALRILKHPCIPDVNTITATSFSDFSVSMRYGGKDFYTLINEQFKFQLDDIMFILYQCLSFLMYLEMNQLCHGDFSSKNVLYESSCRRVSVIDFGSFIFMPSQIKRALVTKTFDPPENKNKYSFTIKGDVFALGILIENLLISRQISDECINKLMKEMQEKDVQKRPFPSNLIVLNCFDRYRRREFEAQKIVKYVIHQDDDHTFMEKMDGYNSVYRKIVIDWLFEIAECFHQKSERKFLPICLGTCIMDRYYHACGKFAKDKYQLVAICCFLVAENLLFQHEICFQFVYEFTKQTYSIHETKNFIFHLIFDLGGRLFVPLATDLLTLKEEELKQRLYVVNNRQILLT